MINGDHLGCIFNKFGAGNNYFYPEKLIIASFGRYQDRQGVDLVVIKCIDGIRAKY